MKFRNRSLTKKNTLILLILFLSAFPILPFGVRSVLMILMLVLALLTIINSGKKKYDDKAITLLIISLLPFIFLVVSLLYSQEIEQGIDRIIKMLALLVFPIVFYVYRKQISKTIIYKSLDIFAISVIILVFYQIINSLLNFDFLFAAPTKLELKNLLLLNSLDIDESVINQIKLRRFRAFIIKISNTHTTYQGLWIVFSLAIILKKIFSAKRVAMKVVLFSLSLVLIGWIFIISTRSSILALIIASFSVLIFYKRYYFKFKFISIFAVSIFIGLFVVYKTLPGFKLKINEVIQTKFELPTRGKDIYNFNSTNVRYGIWYCSLDIISNNMLLGVGVGDSQKELNNCYNSKIGAKIYTWTDYNTHNQYLFFLVSAGILGLIFFLLSISMSFYIAIKKRDILYLFFMIITSIVFLTENVLSRSDGVMFYAMFNALFMFNSKYSQVK